MIQKPAIKPLNPQFSSGPCRKHLGWQPTALSTAFIGRAHRSKKGRERIAELLDRTRRLLELPSDYRIAIVPGSDTGAMEMALWTLLGARPLNVLRWESFGHRWLVDVIEQLKLVDVIVHDAAYGTLPHLEEVDTDRDTVFVWNGTSSGVKVPHADWIKTDRKGLTICDATSAVFAMQMPWDKLDVTTFSWQKALGGEAAHGMIILSPRAVERLEQWVPDWPIPTLFRLTTNQEINEALFHDSPINTPSMLCVEDFLNALKWAEQEGGLQSLIARSEANYAILADWVASRDWIDFLALDAALRSNTSVCLSISDPWFSSRTENDQAQLILRMVMLLEEEEAAFDINAYRNAPPGLRIWCGCTVEQADLIALLPWLDWAYDQIRSE